MSSTAEETLEYLLDAEANGEAAAWTVAAGGEPNLDALERWAEAMQTLRTGIADGTIGSGWIRPTKKT